MIRETGKVLSIETDGVWVETIQQSACQSCAAEKGCGQSLIAKATGRTTAIRALADSNDLRSLKVDDQVVIGIPENVVVTGTLLTYFFPLVLLVVGVLISSKWFNGDFATALGALVGLVCGGLIVRLHSYLNRTNNDVQPTVLEWSCPSPSYISVSSHF